MKIPPSTLTAQGKQQQRIQPTLFFFFFNTLPNKFLQNQSINLMENRPFFGFSLACYFVVTFGIISFGLCIASEFKKTTIEDLKLDGELCSLPGSDSFHLGIASLVCFFIAQMIGISLFITWKIYTDSCLGDVERSGWNWKAGNPTLSTPFLSFSWTSFGIALILLGTATSMSRRQDNREGWIDGECYIVKDGVFGGSGILVLISISLTFVSYISTVK